MVSRPIREKRLVMAGKTKWIAFDFDDTLHDFGRTAAAATDALLAKIRGTYQDVEITQLQDNYQLIGARLIDGFTDGRSSHAYRTIACRQTPFPTAAR